MSINKSPGAGWTLSDPSCAIKLQSHFGTFIQKIITGATRITRPFSDFSAL
jgi:hypothetical protein